MFYLLKNVTRCMDNNTCNVEFLNMRGQSIYRINYKVNVNLRKFCRYFLLYLKLSDSLILNVFTNIMTFVIFYFKTKLQIF